MRTDELIESLTDDLPGSVRPAFNSVVQPWILWTLLAALYVAALTYVLGPFRPGVWQQVVDHPRFALELVLGVAAFFSLALAALLAAVPGRNVRPAVRCGVAALVLWLAGFIVGPWWPILEPSMVGKRTHCAFEAYLYSIPPLLALVWLQRRGHVLRPVRAMVFAAVSAALFPAVVMNVACMYEPAHILKFHVLPIGILTAAALAGLWFVARGMRRASKL